MHRMQASRTRQQRIANRDRSLSFSGGRSEAREPKTQLSTQAWFPETTRALGWRLYLLSIWYVAIAITVPLLAFISWLCFCAWVIKKDPAHAASNIRATGSFYPLRLPRRGLPSRK